MCPGSVFLLFFYHLFELSLSELLSSVSASFHFYPPPPFFSLLSLHLPLHTSPSSIRLPSTSPRLLLLQCVSLVPLTPHTAPIPRKPLQTASTIKAHSQSARQPVQPASQAAFCFDLKLLSSQSQGCFPLLIHIKDPLKLLKFAF